MHVHSHANFKLQADMSCACLVGRIKQRVNMRNAIFCFLIDDSHVDVFTDLLYSAPPMPRMPRMPRDQTLLHNLNKLKDTLKTVLPGASWAVLLSRD